MSIPNPGFAENGLGCSRCLIYHLGKQLKVSANPNSFEMYSKHECIVYSRTFGSPVIPGLLINWMVLSMGIAWKGRWIRVSPAPEKAPWMFSLGFDWYRNNVFDGLVLNLVKCFGT